MSFFKIFFSSIKKENLILYLEFTLLTLIILGPILKPGYLFASDHFMVPIPPFPETVDSYFILRWLLWFLGNIIPSWVLQKIFLFFLFFLSALGTYRLIPTQSRWPKYFGALMYVFNPFVYGRFLYGQMYLLFAYALMPFFLKQAILFFKNPNGKNAIKTLVWISIIVFLSIYHVFFVWMLLGTLWLSYVFFFSSPAKEKKKATLWLFLCAVGFFVINVFWLYPSFRGSSEQTQTLERFDETQFSIFRTATDASIHPLIDTAAMYGFWGERQMRFVNQKDMVPYWSWLFFVLFSLIIYGAIRVFRKDSNHRWIYIALSVVGVVAYLFSVGTAFEPLKPVMYFLYDTIPFFRGFRDSHKFLSITVLVYAYFGAFGMEGASQKLQAIRRFSEKQRELIITLWMIAVFALPIFASRGMLFGFWKQLPVVWYPESWFQVNDLLNRDTDNFEVIVFPWHQYTSLGFAQNQIVANPAQEFFDKKTWVGDNMQIGPVESISVRPLSRFVEKEILSNSQNMENIGERFVSWNIKYIILMGEADFFSYDFLDRQKDLDPIYSWGRMKVYKNTAWKSGK